MEAQLWSIQNASLFVNNMWLKPMNIYPASSFGNLWLEIISEFPFHFICFNNRSWVILNPY